MGTTTEQEEAARAAHLNVLLVDDDQDDSILFENAVSRIADYVVDTAWTNDYADAMRMIREESFDIHFIDFRLSARSGLELISRALELYPQKIFVVVTGFGDDVVAAECLRRGAKGFLSKAKLDAAHVRECIMSCLAPSRPKFVPERTTGHMFDGLTGAYRLKTFMGAARQEIEAERGCDESQALILVDVDNYEGLKRERGEQAARATLKLTAKTLKSCLKRSDMVGRMGEDKVCVLTQFQDAWMCEELCEQIRAAIERHTDITVSIGVAMARSMYADLDRLIEAATEAKRQAQQQGRNLVVLRNV